MRTPHVWHQEVAGRSGLVVRDPVRQKPVPEQVERVMVTRIGLRVPPSTRYEEWELAGLRLSSLVNASAWCLGDWVIFGQDRYGDRYRRAVEAAALDYQTIRNYAWVARRFEPCRRRATLSFQHHAEVAALSEQEQDYWLTQSAEHQWSRNELRRQLRARRDRLSGRPSLHALPQMSIPVEQVDRWRAAATERNTSLESWMVEHLNAAASRDLGRIA